MLLASTAGLRRCRAGINAFGTDGWLSLCFGATEYRYSPWGVVQEESLKEFVRSGYAPGNSVQVPASRLNAVRHGSGHAFGMRKGAHCGNGRPTHGLDSVCDAWMLMFCSDPPSAWPRSCVKRHPVSLAISLPLPYGNKDGTCCVLLSDAGQL